MYTPHTVTIYNSLGKDPETGKPRNEITILNGVFLDISQGENIMRSGLANVDHAILYIPMSIKAVNATTEQEQQYVPPKEYELLEDKTGFWTIGERKNNGCYFVKGKVVEPESDYREINTRYDYAYIVTSVDVRDFGSESMQHWQVGGK